MAKQYPLRPNVCMLVHNREGLLFLGQRDGEPDVWQFPQGGVDPGSTDEESVLRELHEELGPPESSFVITRRLTSTHEYYFNAPREYRAGIFSGQRQSFWLVEFIGKDKELTLITPGHDPEFSAFRWCTIAEIEKRADPKRLVGYRGPLSEVRANLT